MSDKATSVDRSERADASSERDVSYSEWKRRRQEEQRQHDVAGGAFPFMLHSHRA